jgi:hypothetical protein
MQSVKSSDFFKLGLFVRSKHWNSAESEMAMLGIILLIAYRRISFTRAPRVVILTAVSISEYENNKKISFLLFK